MYKCFVVDISFAGKEFALKAFHMTWEAIAYKAWRLLAKCWQVATIVSW